MRYPAAVNEVSAGARSPHPPESRLSPSSENGPTLKWDDEDGGVVSIHLDRELLLVLANDSSAAPLESLFRVRVRDVDTGSEDPSPAVFGRYQVLNDRVNFYPHFPFEPGIAYRATFDFRAARHLGALEPLQMDFALAKEVSARPTVQAIFPSSAELPENLLRFYVSFSNPMQRGRCQEQIALLGPDGRVAPDVLYRAPIELWDRRMQCLTILLDPGRLKRGVGPNSALGPPLHAGADYTLKIGEGVTDIFGQSLGTAYHKKFRAVAAVRDAIVVTQWHIAPPAANSRDPLAITFPRPLDRALLFTSLRVVLEERPVQGRIDIDPGERRWLFEPTQRWTTGRYHVQVVDGLEDVCGNNTLGPFDRSLRLRDKSSSAASHSSVAFSVQ